MFSTTARWSEQQTSLVTSLSSRSPQYAPLGVIRSQQIPLHCRVTSAFSSAICACSSSQTVYTVRSQLCMCTVTHKHFSNSCRNDCTLYSPRACSTHTAEWATQCTLWTSASSNKGPSVTLYEDTPSTTAPGSKTFMMMWWKRGHVWTQRRRNCILGRVALVAQRPIVIKLSCGRSVGLCVRASVCPVHCG